MSSGISGRPTDGNDDHILHICMVCHHCADVCGPEIIKFLFFISFRLIEIIGFPSFGKVNEPLGHLLQRNFYHKFHIDVAFRHCVTACDTPNCFCDGMYDHTADTLDFPLKRIKKLY